MNSTKENTFREVIILNIIEETQGARTFEIASTDGASIKYDAGQFLTLVLNQKNKNKAQRRSYSFSSAPLLNEAMAVTIKEIPNGEISRKLMSAKIGDKFKVSGVSGFFTLLDNLKSLKQLFFIAAGSGITPVFPLIKTALHLHSELSVTLIYANRNKKSTLFYNQLLDLSRIFKNRFQIEFLFSESKNILNSRLSNSLLVDFLNQHIHSAFENVYFFLCGPFNFMETVMITLLTEGVPHSNIRKEKFSILKPKFKIKPKDIEAHLVFIETGNKAYVIKVQYPDSILTEALKENIPIPYSCQSGQCGACVATCLKGKIWMEYNEVLMPNELAKGLVLTCMAYPIMGDVKLKI